MLKRSVENILDANVRDAINHVQEEGLGRALELSAAPTASAPLLQDDERGIYGTDLYVRKGQTIYKFSANATISIT